MIQSLVYSLQFKWRDRVKKILNQTNFIEFHPSIEDMRKLSVQWH